MDASNPMAQQAQPASNQAPNPAAAVNTPQPPSTDSGGNKLIFWLVGGVILIALVVGGIYWYLSKQQAATNTPTTTQTKTQTTATPKPPTISELVSALDKELNAIEVQAADSDFADIDADLQNL